MPSNAMERPRTFLGVTVSSTFADLGAHRAALIQIIHVQGLKAVAMEQDSARPGIDLIDSSLQMVGDGAAYVGLIGHRYGQVPVCPRRNPRGVSITELEFDEAERLQRPILLFIAGDEHAVKPADVESDPEKRAKLSNFRERAKRVAGSQVHRVYATFDSLEQFEKKAFQSISELFRYLEGRSAGRSDHAKRDLEQPPAPFRPETRVDRPRSSKLVSLTLLPLAALITLVYVMLFYVLIHVWPASSAVTMFFILCVATLWVIQRLKRRLWRAR
jgi:hypothetical protein